MPYVEVWVDGPDEEEFEDLERRVGYLEDAIGNALSCLRCNDIDGAVDVLDVSIRKPKLTRFSPEEKKLAEWLKIPREKRCLFYEFELTAPAAEGRE